MVDKARTLKEFLELLNRIDLAGGETKKMTIYVQGSTDKLEVEIKTSKKVKKHLVLVSEKLGGLALFLLFLS